MRGRSPAPWRSCRQPVRGMNRQYLAVIRLRHLRYSAVAWPFCISMAGDRKGFGSSGENYQSGAAIVNERLNDMNKMLLRIVTLCLVVIGLWTLLRSPIWAVKSADQWLIQKMGGQSSTNKYETVMQGFSLNYRLLGGIAVTVGLVRLLWPGTTQ